MTDALAEAVARAVAGEDGYPDHDDGRGDDDTWWQMYQRHATAALQAIEAAGYRVVPVEATEGMVEAGIDQALVIRPDDTEVRSLWSAMLSAAPRVGEG